MAQSKGYVVVASNKPNFYSAAINLIESIKEFDEVNPVCLVTEPRFIDRRAEIVDDIRYCDRHYRAKLWGMTKSPYDLTMYLDADMECEHEDISTCFDQLGDYDIMFTALTKDRDYIYSEREFDTPEGPARFTLCGAVCLYDQTKPLVKEFINDWWELCRKQIDKQWWPEGYDPKLRIWDQFSLWWLTEKEEKYKDLKIGIFEDDLRWNYFTAFHWHRTRPEKPVILKHYSAAMNKDVDMRIV